MNAFRLLLLVLTLAVGQTPARAASTNAAPTVLFIGNSFTYGAGSPVRFFRPKSVSDLNGEGIGGMPALFKIFTEQADRNYSVSLETSPGKNFDFHVANKAAVIGRPWDIVVMHGYSALDSKRPGDPATLVRSGKELAELLAQHNPKVDIRLLATWSRADLTYPTNGHWHGKGIEQMALDVRAGYDKAAAAAAPIVRGVIPVGEAWNRAFKTGVADPNPYDGIAPGQVNLWTHDHYHGSAYGYYLEALMVFGDVTGLDPRSLGKGERAAVELGFSPDQAQALQKVAYDELSVTPGRKPLVAFTPAKAAPAN